MTDFCSYYRNNICRSCTLLETDYGKQIVLKEESLRSLLGQETNLLPTIRSTTSGFRNKAKLVVSGTSENPLVGLLEKEILECPVHDPAINRLLIDLVPFIKTAKLVPYDIAGKKGELKGLIIFHSDEMYLRFVLRSKEGIDRIKKHLPNLLASHPELSSVTVNIQPIHQAILEGEEEISLGPNEFISQSYGKLKLKVRPRAFIQTNQQVATRLYATAAAWVEELKIRKFVELFAGQGAFTFHCAPFVEEAIGIEINPEAVRIATETASELGLSHLKFFPLDAGHSGNILSQNRPDLILVNPPRRGLGESLALVRESGSRWLIYSSCSAESLAKDLKELSGDYQIEKAQIFDMFPHTNHYETLVLLRRSSVKS